MRFQTTALQMLFLCTAALLLLTQVALGQAAPKNKYKDSLLQVLAHPKDDTTKITTLFAMADVYAPNDSAKALDYADQCLRLSQQVKWPKGTGLYYLAKAKISEELTDLSKGIEYGKKSL